MTTVEARRPAWARKGVSVVGMSFDEALAAAKIDFDVKATPACASIPASWHTDGDGNTEPIDFVTKRIPNRQHTYRTDTLEPLGEVGARYHVVNIKQCRDLVEQIVGGGWEPQFAGPVNGGRAVFIVGKLPFDHSPEVAPYLALVNSYDGSTGVRLANTPIRPACTNAIRRTFAQAQAAVSLRHTAKIDSRVDEVRAALNLSRAYYEHLDREVAALMNVAVDEARMKQTVEMLYDFKPTGDKEADAKRFEAVAERRDVFKAHWATTTTLDDQYRYSAWGMINAVTEMEQWFGKNSASDKYAETLLGTQMGLVPTMTKGDRAYKLADRWLVAA